MGWDGLDCFRAMMLGWQTTTFSDEELRVIHLRPEGSSIKSQYHGWARHGKALHFAGAHPVWLLASAMYHLLDCPYVLSGLCMIIGYLEELLKGSQQYGGQEFRRFLRACHKQELARILRLQCVRGLKIFLADTVSRLIWRLGVKKRETGSHIPVLCYHRVLPEFVETADRIYTVLPEQFEAQMAFLAAEGFVSLSLPHYAEIARALRPPPRRSVLITFDDGYADNYRIAWPIAKKYRIKLNLFLCTSLIGEDQPVVMTKHGYVLLKNRRMEGPDRTDVWEHIERYPELWRPLNWQELAEMKGAGVHFGFHSHFHRNLAHLPSGDLAADLAGGLEMFERRWGYRPKFFAIPYGWYDAYTPETITVLRQLNLEIILGTHFGRARLPCRQPVLPRLPIYQSDDLATFQRKLFGAYDWLGPLHLIQHKMLDSQGK
jgi:peptidoglycan/xylan/chitin deacetylase (PgdA/CDA1 family)